jgi:putative toxin-antitoxin system antitoxin component (TIGR02293 family)
MVEAREVASVLGGRAGLGRQVRSFTDLADAIKAGLPSATIRELVSKGLTTAKEISESVRIPERTLMRIQTRDRLPVDESDKIYRLAYLIAMAIKSLGNDDKAYLWLRRANRALGGRTPLNSIGTEPGIREVERVLGQIEYGGVS